MHTPSHENPPVDQSSKNGETTGTEAGAPEVGRMTHVVASAPGILIKRRLQNTLSYCLPTFFASLGLLRRGLRMATTWLLRSAQKRLVSYIHLCINMTEVIFFLLVIEGVTP